MRPISSSVGKSSRWVVSGAGLAALACSYPGFSPDKLAWASIIPGSRPVAAPRQGSSPPLLWHASKGLAEERGQYPDPPLLECEGQVTRWADWRWIVVWQHDLLAKAELLELQQGPHGHGGTAPHTLIC